MNKYFEIVGLVIPCSFILPNNKVFDLRLGIPKSALEVYKSGFKNLGLKPGAEVLFKKLNTSELIELINKARRIEDVEILVLAKDSPKIKEAADEKIKKLKSL